MRPAVRAAALAGLLIPFVLVAVHGQATAAVDPSDPCDSARQALEAGHYQQASKLYRADTKRATTRACGQAGLTATGALSAAGQLLAAGLTAQEGTEIIRALDAVPLLTVPADLMPDSIGLQGEAIAEKLDADGFHAQAVAVLQHVVSADPSLSLDADAKNILGLIPQPLYLRVWHVIASPDAIIGWLVVLAAFVLGTAQKLRRRLYLQQFTAADGIDAGGTLATMLRSLTREELGRLARESARSPGGRRLRLHLAGPYDDRDKIDLGPFADTLPAGMQLLYKAVTLFTSHLGSRSRLVSGMLLSKTTVDLGLETVGGKANSTKVIHHDLLGFPAEGDFQPGPTPPPSPGQSAPRPIDHRGWMQQLALAAAAWIILERYRRRKISLGGTTNWDSYVAFAVGCTWEAAGLSPRHQDRARDCYLLARRDPENTAAAINLAAMELAADLASKPQVPIESLSWYQTLTAIVEATGRRRFLGFRRGHRDLQWYRARYLLAMGLRDFMEVVPPPWPETLETRDYFTEQARELTADVAIELEKRTRSPRWLPKEFVDYGRTAAITLLARQVMTWTADPGQVVTTSWSAGFTKQTISGALRRIRNGYVDKDTSAKLAEFAVTGSLRVDDQSEYNLARYRRRRYEICVSAIESYESALEENPERPDAPKRTEWRDRVLLYQDRLEDQAQEELTQANRYQRQVEQAGDPFLAPEIERLPPLRREPSAPSHQHHPAYATRDRRLSLMDPPDLAPPSEDLLSQPDQSPEESPSVVLRSEGLPTLDRLPEESLRRPVPPEESPGPDEPDPTTDGTASPTRPDPQEFSADHQPPGNAARVKLSPDEEASASGIRQGPYRAKPPVADPRPSWLTRVLRSVGLSRGRRGR